MHPYHPPGLTAQSLAVAKIKEMKYWIRLTKEAAQRNDEKVDLKLSGKADELRSRLEEFFGLDTKAIVNASAAGVASMKKEDVVDEEIRARQWADWQALAEEWRHAASHQLLFRLQPEGQALPIDRDPVLFKSICDVLDAFPPLATDPILAPVPNVASLSHETIAIWLESARLRQDRMALALLRVVREHIYNVSQAAHLVRYDDVAISNTSVVNLISLPTANTLQDAIAQCESGLVARIRAMYGPPDGKKGTAAEPVTWSRYKTNVTRRERLFQVLKSDFKNDKDRFFSFFSKPAKAVGAGSKRSHAEVDNDSPPLVVCYSVSQVLQAIHKCNSDIRSVTKSMGTEERAARWGMKNDFEIWRELGMESYG
ncbi:hypothetical protein K525DRAFT_198431 [Schizophyllum commune Loenen D]|nr:hypothetical protein K525DRAFT_198431 [Schizophyllum commune Loenen D]